MNQKILKFIAKNHLLTLSVRDEDKGVYIANCYYALDKKDCCLLIKSALDSKHIKLAIQNPHLAVSIAKDSIVVKTNQSNGWIRVNYYDENGNPEGESFEGRHR